MSRAKAARTAVATGVATTDETQRRVIAGAIASVERLGLEATTVDDIVLDSGISRATVYRRFGNREAILEALVAQQAGPFVNEAIEVMLGAGDIAGRIERALLLGVANLPPQRGLDEAIAAGPASAGRHPFLASARLRVRAVLALILQSEQVRPGLDIDATLDWFMRELVALLARRPWDDDELSARIRAFILPVFVPDHWRADLAAVPARQARTKAAR